MCRVKYVSTAANRSGSSPVACRVNIDRQNSDAVACAEVAHVSLCTSCKSVALISSHLLDCRTDGPSRLFFPKTVLVLSVLIKYPHGRVLTNAVSAVVVPQVPGSNRCCVSRDTVFLSAVCLSVQYLAVWCGHLHTVACSRVVVTSLLSHSPSLIT